MADGTTATKTQMTIDEALHVLVYTEQAELRRFVDRTHALAWNEETKTTDQSLIALAAIAEYFACSREEFQALRQFEARYPDVAASLESRIRASRLLHLLSECD